MSAVDQGSLACALALGAAAPHDPGGPSAAAAVGVGVGVGGGGGAAAPALRALAPPPPLPRPASPTLEELEAALLSSVPQWPRTRRFQQKQLLDRDALAARRESCLFLRDLVDLRDSEDDVDLQQLNGDDILLPDDDGPLPQRKTIPEGAAGSFYARRPPHAASSAASSAPPAADDENLLPDRAPFKKTLGFMGTDGRTAAAAAASSSSSCVFGAFRPLGSIRESGESPGGAPRSFSREPTRSEHPDARNLSAAFDNMRMTDCDDQDFCKAQGANIGKPSSSLNYPKIADAVARTGGSCLFSPSGNSLFVTSTTDNKPLANPFAGNEPTCNYAGRAWSLETPLAVTRRTQPPACASDGRPVSPSSIPLPSSIAQSSAGRNNPPRPQPVNLAATPSRLPQPKFHSPHYLAQMHSSAAGIGPAPPPASLEMGGMDDGWPADKRNAGDGSVSRFGGTPTSTGGKARYADDRGPSSGRCGDPSLHAARDAGATTSPCAINKKSSSASRLATPAQSTPGDFGARGFALAARAADRKSRPGCMVSAKPAAPGNSGAAGGRTAGGTRKIASRAGSSAAQHESDDEDAVRRKSHCDNGRAKMRGIMGADGASVTKIPVPAVVNRNALKLDVDLVRQTKPAVKTRARPRALGGPGSSLHSTRSGGSNRDNSIFSAGLGIAASSAQPSAARPMSRLPALRSFAGPQIPRTQLPD